MVDAQAVKGLQSHVPGPIEMSLPLDTGQLDLAPALSSCVAGTSQCVQDSSTRLAGRPLQAHATCEANANEVIENRESRIANRETKNGATMAACALTSIGR